MDDPRASSSDPAQQASSGEPNPIDTRPVWVRFPGAYALIASTLIIYMGQIANTYWFGFDLMLEIGAKSREGIQAGEVWRFITPIFLHLSIPHVFINMYSLYAIGPAVERFFGTPRFVSTYLLSGISGVVLSLALSPNPSAGASGAIFGLLGALSAFLYRHRALFGRFGRLQLRQLVLVALLNLGLGLTSGIDNWGHLGGLIAGVVLAWWLGPRFDVVWIYSDQGQLVDRLTWEQSRTGFMIAAGSISLLAIAAIMISSL